MNVRCATPAKACASRAWVPMNQTRPAPPSAAAAHVKPTCDPAEGGRGQTQERTPALEWLARVPFPPPSSPDTREFAVYPRFMGTSLHGLTEAQRIKILGNVQDALIVTDLHGYVLYMNQAAVGLYGFGQRTEEQLESLDLQRYARDTFEVRTLAGEHVPEGQQPLTRALRGEAHRDVELLVRHRDLDETRVFVFSGRSVDSDPPVSVLTIRDETDRWRAERRYRTSFETDPAPSFVARLEDERILQANLGMQEMVGRDKSNIIGKNLSDLELLSDGNGLPESLDGLRAGERIHKRKTTLRHPDDGKPMNALVSARAIEVDGEPCGIFTFIDVTELERSQREHSDAQEELAHARSRLAEQREFERARIARDLHDGVVQELLALNTDLANEEIAFRHRGNTVAAELSRRSRERVLHAAVQLRRAVRGLRPPALQELGLWPSLREALPDLHHPSDPTVVLPEGEGPYLPEEKLVVLHRVAQEAIQNAVKHADASEIRVTFEETRSEGVLQVRDDGHGFHVPERLSILERDGHFGLLSMEERIMAQGGRLEIDSTPGKGTTVRCRLPAG